MTAAHAVAVKSPMTNLSLSMKHFILAALAAAPLMASASGTITMQGKTFRTDTVAHYTIAPGTTHTHLTLTADGRTVQVYALTLDRSVGAPAGVQTRVLMGKDQCQTAESMTSMAQRHSNDSRRYLCGVNGDFFITSSFAGNHPLGNAILGYPNMACAIDGTLAAPDMIDAVSHNSALMISNEGGAWIDAPKIAVKILNNDGSTVVNSEAINYPLGEGKVTVYNRYNGASTRTAAGTREIALVMDQASKWQFNKSIKFHVTGSWSTAGNMAIPENGIVISASPSYSNEFINSLEEGTIVKLKTNITLPTYDNLKPSVDEMIGGDVRILNNGVVTTEAIRWINTPGSQYPRSLTGISEDGNVVVMAAVDGGSTLSSGVSYYEAADLMAALGCYNALDLDGGGSTAMYTRHAGIVNRPRDGSERAIGNALYFAIDAPANNTLTSIAFARHAIRIPQFGSYAPVLMGYNANGELMNTDLGSDFTLTAPSGLEINGNTVTGVTPGCYALTATFNGLTATVPVAVVEVENAAFAADNIVIDAAHAYTLPLTATVDGEDMPLDPKAFSWTSSAEDVITIDAQTGEMTALKNGSSTITATRGDIVLTATVNVQIAGAPFLPLEAEFDLSTWKLTRSGLGTDAAVTVDENGVYHISFTISNPRAPKFTLAKTIAVYGRPDRMTATIVPMGTTVKAFNVALRTSLDSRPTTLSAKNLSATETTDVVWNMAEELDIDNQGAYPLLFSQFSIEPGTGADGGNACALQIHNLGFEYDSHASGVDNVIVDTEEIPVIVCGDTVTSPSATSIAIYNPAGVLVSAGTNSAVIPGNGVYIVKVSGSGTRTVKICR